MCAEGFDICAPDGVDMTADAFDPFDEDEAPEMEVRVYTKAIGGVLALCISKICCAKRNIMRQKREPCASLHREQCNIP